MRRGRAAAGKAQHVREHSSRRREYCHLPDWLPPLGPFYLEHILACQEFCRVFELSTLYVRSLWFADRAFDGVHAHVKLSDLVR